MVEVRAGLLLGNEDDALALFSKKHAGVSHILSVTSQPPDWADPDQSDAAVVPSRVEAGDGEALDDAVPRSCGEIGEAGVSESADTGLEDPCTHDHAPPPLTTMFLQATDVPDTDLLHHFERCCQFIKQGVEQGGILVHWYALGRNSVSSVIPTSTSFRHRQVNNTEKHIFNRETRGLLLVLE